MYRINKHISNIIFEYLTVKLKLNLLKNSKKLQNKYELTIFDYQNYYFLKNKKIDRDILLNYYQYLKRAYLKIYDLKIIQEYFIEFFCKFLKENNITNYILDSSHELTIDILLNKNLKKIQILINIDDYKSNGLINKCHCYKNKKPFLKLFQSIFNNPKVDKIIILQNRKEKDDNDNDNEHNSSYSTFRHILIQNLNEYYPNIETNDISIIESLYHIPNNSFFTNNINKFKLIELNIPLKNNIEYYNL